MFSPAVRALPPNIATGVIDDLPAAVARFSLLAAAAQFRSDGELRAHDVLVLAELFRAGHAATSARPNFALRNRQSRASGSVPARFALRRICRQSVQWA